MYALVRQVGPNAYTVCATSKINHVRQMHFPWNTTSSQVLVSSTVRNGEPHTVPQAPALRQHDVLLSRILSGMSNSQSQVRAVR